MRSSSLRKGLVERVYMVPRCLCVIGSALKRAFLFALSW